MILSVVWHIEPQIHSKIQYDCFFMHILMDLLMIGALSGVLSGLLGIGGGIIVVPALAYWFKVTDYHFVPQALAMQMTVASSLMTILFTSISSARSHHFKGSVRWDIWRKWVLGLCLGAILGAILVVLLNAMELRFLFSLFLLGVVIKLLAGKWLPKLSLQPRVSLLLCMGIVIGLASGLLGVGGGILMVPILIGLGCTMSESAGTSSASTVPLALVGGVSFIITGWVHGVSIPWATGYIYWPAVLAIGIMGVLFAPLGVKLSYIIPAVWLKRLLAALLLAISIQMLV